MATRVRAGLQAGEAAAARAAADGARAIPGINHPVFRGKPVNTDPREAFVAELMRERDERNVFHDYYRAVVQALYDQGVTNNVFCVNVDGVIAAWLLKLLWQPYRSGELGSDALGERGVHDLPARPDGRARPPRSRTTSIAAATWIPAPRPRP